MSGLAASVVWLVKPVDTEREDLMGTGKDTGDTGRNPSQC